jgi:D-threo-aldose 1-dehydrogenase
MKTADAIVTAAWDSGIRYFDTAPQYGQGKSEARVGRILQQFPRDGFVLSTKVGHLFSPPSDRETFARTLKGGGLPFESRSDYSHDGILRSYEHSLLRLGLNRIDMLIIHDLDVSHHGSRAAVDAHMRALVDGGGWRALHELKASGEIQAIGCGINLLGQIPEMLANGELDFFLVAMPYTLLDQDALDVEFPLCERRGASIVVGSVFSSGILATGAREGASYAYAPAPQAILDKAAAIERVCKSHGVSLQSAALQFPLGHPLVSAIIPGAYRVENIGDNLASFRRPIPPQLWAELKSEGLLRADAPTDRLR